MRGVVSSLRQLLECAQPHTQLAPHAPTLLDALLKLACSNAHPSHTHTNTIQKQPLSKFMANVLHDSTSIANIVQPKSGVETCDVCSSHQPIAVREESLVCLKLLSQLPTAQVLPYREKVGLTSYY